jgi:hypothetical protein
MHHDFNMEGVDSNVYEHSDGPMTRARAKQLQNALTSQISTTEASMSLRACKLIENGSNMFVCLQIRLGSLFGSFDEFGFAVSPRTNFGPNLLLFNAFENKSCMH